MKEKIVSIPLTVLIILSLLLGGPITTVAVAGTGALAFDKELALWVVGSEPPDRKFDLKLKITNVTDATGAVWSIRYNSSLFTVEIADLSVPPPSEHWLYPLGVGGSITSFPLYDHLSAGEAGEFAQLQITPFAAKTFADPSWGWVASLTFQYIGPTPAVGSAIDTDITIVNDPGASCATAWTPNGITWINFENLGECHFHYERALKAVHLESDEDTAASTNLGTITFDGVSYSLPNDVSRMVGTYQAQYFADTRYMFYHWETTGTISVSEANVNPTTVTVSGNGTLKAIYASHHIDHLNDGYAPMVIPVNGKNLTIAPVIMCTILENDVFKPFHHPCKSAQTTLTDNDWSDNDANYTYVFEDWIDYDWNDIEVSLYAIANDVITVEIRLADREAAWKNPFGVEITPTGMAVEAHWNSTDYPEEHVTGVNSSATVDVGLFAESNPGDAAFITIIPLIPPTYKLTITSILGGTTDPIPGSYSYDEGTVVSVTAIPEWDYIFDHWKLDGADVGSANPIDVTMNANHTLHAVFTKINYTLTITTTTGGTTSPSPGDYVYSSGTNVFVTAIRQGGYLFDHWKMDGVNKGSVNPLSVTIDKDHILHAVFRETPPAGGHAMPIEKTHLLFPKIGLTPRIGLALSLLVTMAVTVILIRRKKRH